MPRKSKGKAQKSAEISSGQQPTAQKTSAQQSSAQKLQAQKLSPQQKAEIEEFVKHNNEKKHFGMLTNWATEQCDGKQIAAYEGDKLKMQPCILEHDGVQYDPSAFLIRKQSWISDGKFPGRLNLQDEQEKVLSRMSAVLGNGVPPPLCPISRHSDTPVASNLHPEGLISIRDVRFNVFSEFYDALTVPNAKQPYSYNAKIRLTFDWLPPIPTSGDTPGKADLSPEKASMPFELSSANARVGVTHVAIRQQHENKKLDPDAELSGSDVWHEYYYIRDRTRFQFGAKRRVFLEAMHGMQGQKAIFSARIHRINGVGDQPLFVAHIERLQFIAHCPSPSPLPRR